MKAYRYGDDLLPIDSTTESLIKLEKEEGEGVDMRVLATFRAEDVPRWHALANALAVSPNRPPTHPPTFPYSSSFKPP